MSFESCPQDMVRGAWPHQGIMLLGRIGVLVVGDFSMVSGLQLETFLVLLVVLLDVGALYQSSWVVLLLITVW